MRLRRVASLLAAPVVLSACELPNVIPDAVTRQGDRMRGLWWFSNWVALAVVVLVWVLVAYVVLRFRARGRTDLPAQRAENVPAEILYTAGPLLVVALLFGLSVAVQEDVTDTADQPDVVVDVVGFQWGWQFTYPDHDVVLITTEEAEPELVLPVGQTVQFRLETRDVIHSFWVPQFLSKRDLIPRIDNSFDVEITEEGRWRGRCAEFCGIYHHEMNFTVRAVPPGEFDDWLDRGGDR